MASAALKHVMRRDFQTERVHAVNAWRETRGTASRFRTRRALAHRASAERFTAKPATVGALCATESVSETRSSASSARSVPETGRATAKNRRRRSPTPRGTEARARRSRASRFAPRRTGAGATRARAWRRARVRGKKRSVTDEASPKRARRGRIAGEEASPRQRRTSSLKGSFSFSERLVAELVSPLVPTSDFRSPSSSSPRSISSTFSLRTLSLRRNVTHKTSRSTSPRVPHSIKYETTPRFFIMFDG